MKMKRITFLLLLVQSGFLFSQTKTVVTQFGERVTISPFADNGLTQNNGYTQLGGALTKPSILTTSVDNTLAIGGLQIGSFTDQFVTIDANGVLRKMNNTNWDINGNSGTNGSLNFLGTKDDQPLQFKINNTYSGLISKTATSIGYNSLNPLTTGLGNTAFGVSTLTVNTSGWSNTAMGNLSLSMNTTGSANTAYGSLSLRLNTTGTSNTAIGSSAMDGNTTGVANVAVGTAALNRNDVGSYNVGIGWQALNSNTADGNTAIGYKSLNNNTTGSNNLSIGYHAGANITSGNGNIMIGSGVSNTVNASSATANNEMNIGNTLYGLGVNNIIGSGKIGINTNAPTAELDVNGQARVRKMNAGTVADNIVTVDSDGNLHQIPQPEAAAFTLGFASLGAGVDVSVSNVTSFLYTGSKVTLPPGKWLVTVNMLLTKSATSTVVLTSTTESWWVRSSFSNSSTTFNVTPDIISGNSLVSGLLPPNSPYGLLFGTVIINNTTAASKTYYYWCGNILANNATGIMAKFGGTNWSEDYISYQKIN